MVEDICDGLSKWYESDRTFGAPTLSSYTAINRGWDCPVATAKGTINYNPLSRASSKYNYSALSLLLSCTVSV